MGGVMSTTDFQFNHLLSLSEHNAQLYEKEIEAFALMASVFPSFLHAADITDKARMHVMERMYPVFILY